MSNAPRRGDIAIGGRVRHGVAARKDVDIELLNYKKDGTAFWNQLHLSPIFDDDGKLAYYFGSQVDVTSYRKVQALEASEHRLLMEVDHRAKTVLAVVPDEEPDAMEVIALIEKEGRKAVSLSGDLRDESFCEKLVEDAAKALGGLDIFVSNAGRQQQVGKLSDFTSDACDATIKTNIYAMFWLTKAALKHLQSGSAIIITTSEQAYDPSEDLVTMR